VARSAPDHFDGKIAVSTARALLDQVTNLDRNQLPLGLIAEPVREATAAGAGAISATRERTRESFLVVDIGAGTTDVAGFICVNNPDWVRPRIFEISGAADARNAAVNVLDNALQKYVLENCSLSEGSDEYRMAGLSIRRSKRIYKEQLFATGSVSVPLPTDEVVTVTLDEFKKYDAMKNFVRTLKEMIGRSAAVVAGDSSSVNLVPTGGGSSLPIIAELAAEGVEFRGRVIKFVSRDPVLREVRDEHPDLVDIYPQIAVALGGSLPSLPEQRSSESDGLKNAPSYVATTTYKS